MKRIFINYEEYFLYREVIIMILGTSERIAAKCSACGKYNIMDINIFNMKIPTSLRCVCGNKILETYVKKGEFNLEMNCITCETNHRYKFKVKDIVEKNINIVTCPTTGMELAFIGKDSYVDDIVKRYMDDMLELLTNLGLLDEKPSRVVK